MSRKKVRSGEQQIRILVLLDNRGRMNGGDILEADSSLPPGTVYTTLKRMESRGLVQSEQVKEKRVAGPPRRYFSISKKGRRYLKLCAELLEL